MSKKKKTRFVDYEVALNEAEAKFTSNVTGIGWAKYGSANFKRVIDKIGVILEDEVHRGKNNTTTTLKKGTEVIIDDIRGRINPQYRVKDQSGKIWFVAANNVKFTKDETEQISEPIYRGGIRVDGEEDKHLPQRYEVPATTEEEINKLKEKKEDG
tara:strand:- start:130 stop:597 length:468 start_codon:yes stop_codon:yes gene_type:complete